MKVPKSELVKKLLSNRESTAKLRRATEELEDLPPGSKATIEIKDGDEIRTVIITRIHSVEIVC